MLYITSKCNIIDLSLILGPTSTSVLPIELIVFNKSLLYKVNGPVMAFCYGYSPLFSFQYLTDCGWFVSVGASVLVSSWLIRIHQQAISVHAQEI